MISEEEKTIDAACNAFRETYDNIIKIGFVKTLDRPELKNYPKEILMAYGQTLILKGIKKFTVELENEVNKTLKNTKRGKA